MFKIKNIKQKNRVIPSSTGLIKMMFALMKVSDVIIKNDDNTDTNIRISTEEDILEWEYRIKNGIYNPEEFIPPTVDENGKLITGRHRFEAHKGLDIEYIEVCVIKFVKTKDHTGLLKDEKHWQTHWQNIENLTKPKEHKRMASEQDIAFSVLKMIKNKSLLLNKNDIESYLKTLNLTPNKIKNIIKEVYSRSNKQNDIPLQYTAEDIKKEVNKDKKIIFSTPKSIELSSNDTIHFVQTFKKTQADEKHKQLIFDAMLNSLNKSPKEIFLHYSANTIDYKVVSKLEKNIEKYFYQYINKITRQVKMLQKINIKEKVKFNPMNQKKIS
jgi:hypothetical protein